MTRILVTGASGLLGLNFSLQVSGRYEVVGVVHQNQLTGVPFPVAQADLSAPGKLEEMLREFEPQVVLHCAALANVDACEDYPEKAYRINAEVPGELAKLCAQQDIHFVHISTDAVFDGQEGNYLESDLPNPINTYAETKLAAEHLVAAANPNALIARVNFYGYSIFGKRSLGEFFVNHLAAGEPVKGFTDVIFCPLQVNDLADVLLEMIEKRLSGLYHVLSPESLSKYDFGCRIAEAFGFDTTLISPITWADAGLKATRSPNLTLRVDKLQRDLGHSLPGLEQGIRRFHSLYQEGYPERIQSLVKTEL